MPGEATMLHTLASIWRILPGGLRLRLKCLAALGLVVSLAQLAVVACISLMGAALASPEQVASMPGMAWLGQTLLAVSPRPNMLLPILAGITVAVVAANNALRALNEYLSVRISREVERNVGADLLAGFLNMPYEWFLRHNSSDLVLNIYWASHYATVARMGITFVSEAASTAFILLGLLVLAPGFTLATVVIASGLSMGLFHLLRRRLDTYSTLYREVTLDRQRLLNVAMQGVKDAKISGCESSLARWCDELMKRSVLYAANQELTRSAPMFLLEPLGFLVIMGMVAFMALDEASNSRILGTASLMAAAGWKILPCVNKILSAVVSLRTSWPFVQKTEGYLRQVAEQATCEALADEARDAPVPPGFNTDLRLENIGFQYQTASEPGLQDICLRISRGEVMGIVGRSGAGKSTLVNILAGLLQPNTGTLRIDGRTLSGREFRRWQVASIGYVPQAPFISDATLAENIAFGLRGEQINLDRVRECCQMAAIDFLDELPQGLHTPIGERGLRLSGGQQQRVAIARALYKNPDIIIFDEATSSLDTKSEQEIQQTIYGLRGRKTLVIVAHRLSTVEACDRVYWVDKGRVHMEGSPGEVLACYTSS